jgi:hypothetical protein
MNHKSYQKNALSVNQEMLKNVAKEMGNKDMNAKTVRKNFNPDQDSRN